MNVQVANGLMDRRELSFAPGDDAEAGWSSYGKWSHVVCFSRSRQDELCPKRRAELFGRPRLHAAC